MALSKTKHAALMAVFASFLFLPMMGNILGLAPKSHLDEKRKRAVKPELVFNAQTIPEYPGRFEKYFNDCFGFRDTLIYWHNYVTFFWLGSSPSEKVIVGKQGWLFYNDPSLLLDYRRRHPFPQSRLDLMERYLTLLKRWTDERGINLMFLIPPNKHSVYPEFMPDHITRGNETPNRIAFVKLCSQLDVTVADLSDTILTAKKREQVYYRFDTHWNHAGLYEAYRQSMTLLAKSYPDLSFQPKRLFSEHAKKRGPNDLAALMGLGDDLTESCVDLVPPNAAKTRLTHSQGKGIGSRYIYETHNEKLPRAMFCGDSFGMGLVPFLNRHFRRFTVVWSYNFEPGKIEEEQPDLVMYEFLERFLGSEKQLWDDLVRLLGAVDGVIPAAFFHRRVGDNTVDLESDAWMVRKATTGATKPGWLMFGRYRALDQGSCSVAFRMKSNGTGTAPIVRLDAAADMGKRVLSETTLAGLDFNEPGQWQEFNLKFTVGEGGLRNVEFRAEYLGNADLSIDTIRILPHP